MKNRELSVKKIKDSRGELTLEVCIKAGREKFIGSVPSGASTGDYEAVSLPPREAERNLEGIIFPALGKERFSALRELDNFLVELDGSPRKSCLGANALLAISIAFAKFFAAQNGLELFEYIARVFAGRVGIPRPFFNIINGGAHAKNNIDIQEFIISPNLGRFKANLGAGEKIYEKLQEILRKKFGRKGIILGDEGGFAPPLKNSEEALWFLREAVEGAGFTGKEIEIGLDCAASEFYKDGGYNFEGRNLCREELLKVYLGLAKNYSLSFLEDPFDQNDKRGWRALTKTKLFEIIIGDDLIATNAERIKMATEEKLCDGVIIKPNQIGTVSEAAEAAKIAKEAGWRRVVSHRSGETMDDFIADLSAGVGAEFIKSGAPYPPERMAKYRRLLAIENKTK